MDMTTEFMVRRDEETTADKQGRGTEYEGFIICKLKRRNN